MIANALLLIITVAVLAVVFRRDYFRGICGAVFVLVFAPYNIFLELPGPVPNLTIQRLVVLVMAWFWLRRPGINRNPAALPLFVPFLLVILSAAASATLSLVPVPSVKSLLSLVVEEYLLFVILMSSMRGAPPPEHEHVMDMLTRSIIAAVSCAAVLALVERWTRFNFVNYLPSHAELPDFLTNVHVYKNRVTATLPHPILLGYCLGMSWPLVLVAQTHARLKRWKWVLSLCFLASGIAVYFTESRGAWLGSILAGTVVLACMSWAVRRRMLLAAVAVAVVLVARPQITDTIVPLINSTWNTESLKGRSANYRLELWRKANLEIGRSATRYLVGYGDNAHSYVDWSDFEEETGRFSTFWSWDNEYAAVLLERGVIGFAAFALLHALLWLMGFRAALAAPTAHRDRAWSLWASITVYLFMMTNVKVFSPQVKVLFLISSVMLLASRRGGYAASEESRVHRIDRDALGAGLRLSTKAVAEVEA